MVGWLDGQGWDSEGWYSPLTGPQRCPREKQQNNKAKREQSPFQWFPVNFLRCPATWEHICKSFLCFISFFAWHLGKKLSYDCFITNIYHCYVTGTIDWRHWSNTTFSVVLIWYPSSICIYQCSFGHLPMSVWSYSRFACLRICKHIYTSMSLHSKSKHAYSKYM